MQRPDNYDAMKEWYEERTNRHIGLVNKYIGKIADVDHRFVDLLDRIGDHDSTKFEEPELEPYIFIAWQYKCKDDDVDFDVPEELNDEMTAATNHHVKNNRHHPEHHSDQDVQFINRADRDKPPEQMVDATKMPDMDIAEMCADWMAMSEERGNAPQDWAKSNINIRWKFTPEQEGLIYHLLDNVWEADHNDD